MSYSTIDPTIDEWATRNRLTLYTQHQESSVRAVHVTDAQGRTYRIGVEAPDKDGQVVVRASAWDFKNRNRTFVTTASSLAGILEQALAAVKEWQVSE